MRYSPGMFMYILTIEKKKKEPFTNEVDRSYKAVTKKQYELQKKLT